MKPNPKEIRAAQDEKVPMQYIPWGPLAAVSRVMKSGADKYGRLNWRRDHIKASTYVGAISRHALLEWAAGSNEDKDSGEHPLAHVIATCLIVMDAEEQGTLIDDRLVVTERDTKFDVVEQSARSVPLNLKTPNKVQEDTHCGADRTQFVNDGSSDMNDPYWHCPHCGHDEHWFDRSFHINEDGTQEGPFYRCRSCGLPDETQ